MTGGVPIMRPYRCWTALQVSILALMVLASNTDSADSDCEVLIKVRRQTVYEAFLGQNLTINCTVGFCTSSKPAVFWFKLWVNGSFVPVNVNSSSHITTKWIELSRGEGISYLIFKKVVVNDSGLYQCHSGNGVSHNINVSVKGDGEFSTVKWEKTTNEPTSTPDLTDTILMYVYPAAGIVTLVVVVIIISVISMRGCKGKSQKESQAENQYMEIPMVEQAFPRVNLQPSPRQSPSAPPSRRSTRKQRPSSQPNGTPGDNEQLYNRLKDGRERRRNAAEEEEEEGGSVVYAALNHQLPPGAAAPRPQRQEDDFSEYAAIRVS